jgi:hypothetical protein
MMGNRRPKCDQEDQMRDRQGCLEGLLEMFFLTAVFDWMQDRFGFGRGLSCSGCGCGLILLVIFLLLACSVIGNTNWLRAF